MGSPKIEFEQLGDAEYIEISFDTIESVINSDIPSSTPIIIHGRSVNEILNSYTYSQKYYSNFSRVIVGKERVGLTERFRDAFRGRMNLFNKLSGYTASNGYQIERWDRSTIKLFSDYEFAEEDFIQSFMTSRRSPFDVDIVRQFYHLMSYPNFGGPYIIRSNRDASYDAVTAIKRWSRNQDAHLIFLIENDDLNDADLTLVERDYIAASEIDASFSIKMNRSIHEIQNLKSLFRATSRASKDETGNTWTRGRAIQFFNFLTNLPDDMESSAGESFLLPQQQAAPLMFQSTENGIDISQCPLQGASPQQIMGAARALKNQAHDILGLPALENAVPRAFIKINRIISILDRLASESTSNESDVVELGVEISSLEGSTHSASSRIGELSMAEILIFFDESKSFLNRFYIWVEYYRDSSAFTAKSELNTLSNISSEILSDGATQPFVTSNAADRVTHTTRALNDTPSELEKQSLTISAENFAAAVGREALDAAKEVAKDTGDKIKRDISQKTAEAASNFLRNHGASLLHLAETRGHRWLEMLLVQFGIHR